MHKFLFVLSLFSLNFKGYAQNENGNLLFDGVYTQNGQYVVFTLNQQEWGFDGLRLLTTFNIYERCLYHNDKSYPYVGNETCLGIQCRRYGSNNDDYYLVDVTGNVKWSFSVSMSVPFLGNVRSTSLTFFDYGNWITNPILNEDFSTASSSSTSYDNNSINSAPTATCACCNGSGKCGDGQLANWKYYCHGSRICRNCNGKGYYLCTDYGLNKYMECTFCNGTGDCGYCHGSGKCRYCGGKGKK